MPAVTVLAGVALALTGCSVAVTGSGTRVAAVSGHGTITTTSVLASGRALVEQGALAQLVFTAAGTLSSPTVKDSPAVDGQPAVVVDFGGTIGRG